MFIWDSKTGNQKAGFEWKNTAKDGPNSIVFSQSEEFVANQPSKNVIHIFKNGDFSKPDCQIIAKPPKTGAKGGAIMSADKCRFDGFKFVQQVDQNSNIFFIAW